MENYPEGNKYGSCRIKINRAWGRAALGITGAALISLFIFALVSILLKPISASATASSSSITSDSIKEKEEQIDSAEKEKEQLESELSDLQKIKDELESQKTDLQAYVSLLDSNLADIEANIAELNASITAKETEISETEKQLEEALEKEEAQKEAMLRHIRMMYERDDSYIIDMLLNSSSYTDFLVRADYAELVAAYDLKMWEELIQIRQYIELCREELALEKEILDQTKSNVQLEQANLESLIQQKNEDITAYETDINSKEQAISDYEAMIKAQDDEIKALEEAIAAEKRSILESNGSVIYYDGGIFKFPLATYTRISDDYGYRIHPTLGVEQFHNGVDFAAPKGTAIYAAYDGIVVAATYSATMGNYVMIDHGSGLYTIYMHASALYVSKDDVVVRGDTIAAVGSTGRSTGNHLHFSVRKDGEYVSPWNYISE